MGHGYKHGTSGGKKDNPLNFEVKTYPSETELKADTPKVNTVGVLTTTTMNHWVFSPNEPTTPEVGMVWLKIGEGETGFNALKENEIRLIPGGAKQYVSGEWKDVEYQLWVDGKWLEGSSSGTLLFADGNQYTDITGGWSGDGWTAHGGYQTSAGTVDSSGITVTTTSETKIFVIGTNEKVDLSKVKTIYAIVDEYEKNVYNEAYFAVNSIEKKVIANADGYTMSASATITTTGEIALDVSAINTGYIVLYNYGMSHANSKVKITKIRME